MSASCMPGLTGAFAVDTGEKEALEAVIDFQAQAKQQGATVHSSHNLLAYEKALLNGEAVDWTCLAGYKYFFVTAKGNFGCAACSTSLTSILWR